MAQYLRRMTTQVQLQNYILMDFRRDKTLSSVPTPSLSFLIAAAKELLLLLFLMVLLMKSESGCTINHKIKYAML
jgi:hypothetical protein